MTDLLLDGTKALRPGWRAFLFYVAVTVVYGLQLWAFHSQAWLPAAAYPLGLCAVLLMVSWVFLALEGRRLPSLGLRPGRAWALDYGKGLLAGAAIILLTAAGVLAAGGCHLDRAPGQGVGTLGAGALFYLVPAVNEELAFRGYLFQRLETSLGSWGSLAVMSLLFGAAHLGNPGLAGAAGLLAFLNICLAGVILGLAYLRTRSLALPMGLHLGWNWTQGSLLGFGVSGTTAHGYFLPALGHRPGWVTGGAFGLEGSLFCTVVCLVGCLILGAARTRLDI